MNGSSGVRNQQLQFGREIGVDTVFDYRTLSRSDYMSLPWEKRIAYFTFENLVLHERATQILDDLLMWATPGSGAEIILLIGAGGAGKTALLKIFRRRLLERYMAAMLDDSNLIPFVFESAKGAGQARFRWNVFYQRLCRRLNVPLIEHVRKDVVEDGVFKMIPMPGRTYQQLEMCVGDGLFERKTVLLVVDEVTHIFGNASEAEKQRHMDVFKTFTNLSNLALVFAGSYENQDLVELSGQMTRRCIPLYLQPYTYGKGGVPAAFSRYVKTLAGEMPIDEPPDLDRYMEIICINCSGLSGKAKDLLARASCVAHDRYKGKWNESCLECSLFPDASVVTSNDEIETGEARLENGICGVALPAGQSRLNIENLRSGLAAEYDRRYGSEARTPNVGGNLESIYRKVVDETVKKRTSGGRSK
jgi:hypothetical protein